LRKQGVTAAWLAQWGTPLVLGAAVLLVGLSSPHFLTVDNLRNVGTQVPVNLILAAGMTVVILTGGIDLSVGSVHALCGISAALVITNPALTAALGGWTVPLAVVAAVGLGVLIGAVNGGAIAWIGIPPFIVTLAMMSMGRGIAKHITNGVPIGLIGPETASWQQVNASWDALRPLGLGYVGAVIPTSFLLAVGVIVILAVMLARTRQGRYVYAVGSNEDGARLAGVPVARTKLLAYTLMGLLAGLTGAIEAAAQQNGSPIAGQGYELTAIAAVVVGGTSLTGGRGGVIGTFVGAVFVIGLMNNALNLHSVPSFWQEVAKGAIIFGVAVVDRLSRRA
jgi:ribose transport system permease protein